MHWRIGVLSVSLALAASASAQPSKLEMVMSTLERQAQKGEREFYVLIHGMGVAYTWVNAELETARKSKPLYCPPDSLVLNAKNYADIILREYKKNKADYMRGGEHPVDMLGAALLRGLQATFPCK